MRQHACANATFRKQPETFRLALAIRKPRSARLLLNGVPARLVKRRTFFLRASRRPGRLCAPDLATGPRRPFFRGGISGISLRPCSGISLQRRAARPQRRMESRLSDRRLSCRRAMGGSLRILSARGRPLLSVTAWSPRSGWAPHS